MFQKPRQQGWWERPSINHKIKYFNRLMMITILILLCRNKLFRHQEEENYFKINESKMLSHMLKYLTHQKKKKSYVAHLIPQKTRRKFCFFFYFAAKQVMASKNTRRKTNLIVFMGRKGEKLCAHQHSSFFLNWHKKSAIFWDIFLSWKIAKYVQKKKKNKKKLWDRAGNNFTHSIVRKFSTIKGNIAKVFLLAPAIVRLKLKIQIMQLHLILNTPCAVLHAREREKKKRWGEKNLNKEMSYIGELPYCASLIIV